MDSISENVVAMIAVVVGILIIGTALVPIVQHASGTETTETVTGPNTYDYDQDGSYFGIAKPGTAITLNNDGYSAKGTPIDLTDDQMTLRYADSDFNPTGEEYIGLDNELLIYVYSIEGISGDYIVLKSGTITVAADGITITGITEDDADFTGAIPKSGSIALITSYRAVDQFLPKSDIFSLLTSPFTIGTGQYAMTMIDDAMAEITTVTEAPEGWGKTMNANGTATYSAPEGSMIMGPLEWSQDVTTSGTSEYAALYGIIPIMCILAMAYVLIRRF